MFTLATDKVIDDATAPTPTDAPGIEAPGENCKQVDGRDGRNIANEDNCTGLKIYRNYHPLRTGEELMEALERGNAVVTDVNGNAPGIDIIADLCFHFDKFKEVKGNIVSMKMDEFKTFKSGISSNNNILSDNHD